MHDCVAVLMHAGNKIAAIENLGVTEVRLGLSEVNCMHLGMLHPHKLASVDVSCPSGPDLTDAATPLCRINSIV